MTEKQLIDFFNKNKLDYKKKEIWSWVVNFVKKVFTDFLLLKEESSYKITKRNTFTQESTIQTWSNSRSDFILNYKWIKIVVEVEKTNNIDPWIKQIKEYMNKENTLYWILTDWESWYFYDKWFNESAWKFWWWTLKTIDNFLNNSWVTFFDSFFETKNYYINFLDRIDSESFYFTEDSLKSDLKSFHKELIEIAEKLKVDFEKSGIFDWNEDEKEIIQTVYSFIIQFLLIKIVQDKKKNLKLINKKEFVSLLNEEKYSELANSIFKQIEWLWNFYDSYKNEQKYLIDKILKHYNIWLFSSNIDFLAVQWFLDLYIFIFKFNFKNVKQDIFWAVYENYLKELYKDDNSKKWQVFTPPEIVDFMLDEIWYTSDYIYKTIEEYIIKNWLEELQEKLLINEKKPDFNIPWLSIIDPACWSGTFLYKASGRIVSAIYKININYEISTNNSKYPWILSENLILNNIFWFDIEAFPLYLAEMNILQTLLWFNIDDKTWEVLNKIDKQVRIFSTKDTIWEFANMQNNINEILENLEKPPIFSVSEKINPKAISELKLDIINWNLESKLEKYLVYYIWEQLFHLDNTLEKNIKEIDNLTQLRKYVKNSKNTLLIGLEKRIFKEAKTYIEDLHILAEKYKTSRTKFNFVIWNPPYVQMLKQEIKNKIDINIFLENDSLSNYWKHSWANINIFHKFIILWYFLLKNQWKISFIIPWDFISQLSANQIRNFIKEKTFVNKIFSFWDNKLFVERGLSQKIEVATTSCIINFQKSNNTNNNTKLFTYEKDSINDFFIELEKINKNNSDIKDIFRINNINQKILNENWKITFNWFEKLLHILNSNKLWEIEKCDDDMIITKSTEIEKKKKQIKDNSHKIDWEQYFNFIEFEDIYKNSKDIKFIYDIQNMPFNKGRIAPVNMLNKKYKIIWNKINNKKNDLKFMFVDYPIIWHNNGYLSFWSNSKEKVLFYFNLFKSKFWQLILKSVISEQWNTYQLNATDINNFVVPNINWKIKEKLIKNWTKIIESIKNNWWGKLDYRDILEVEIDWMDQKIIWIKKKFEYLNLNIEEIKRKDLIDEKISEIILEKIKTKNCLEKLEKERDLLVYCWYFWKENWEENFINLNKINIENIEESEKYILNNYWVKLIENY